MENRVTLNDMVFENKNKEYGAFELRLNYAKTLNKAFLIGTSLFLGIAFSSFTYYKNLKSSGIVTLGPEINMTDFSKKKINTNDIKKIIPKKTNKIQVKTIIYIAPKVVLDTKDIIEITVPSSDKIDNSVIGDQNITEGIDGNFEIDMVNPPTQVEIKQVDLKINDDPINFVEQQPEFIGGVKAMYKFISQNLIYPKQASNSGVSGKVILKFIVERDGSVTNIEILKGIGFGCDESAINALKLMPNWNPGKQNGTAVRVYYTIPINFQLDN